MSGTGELPRRLGRPPRVTRSQIAEAVLTVGLNAATMKTVAAELGMSVPGLYHHVSTRADLLKIAAEYSFRLFPEPFDDPVSWDDYVLDYARRVYDSLVGEPGLINQIQIGNFLSSGMVLHLESFLSHAHRRGFSHTEAYRLWIRLISAAIGSALLQAADHILGRTATTYFDGLTRAADALAQGDRAHVSDLCAEGTPPDHFDNVRVVVQTIVDAAPGGARAGKADLAGKIGRTRPRPANRSA